MDSIESSLVVGLPLLWKLSGEGDIERSLSLYPSGGRKKTPTSLVRAQ